MLNGTNFHGTVVNLFGTNPDLTGTVVDAAVPVSPERALSPVAELEAAEVPSPPSSDLIRSVLDSTEM